MSCLHLDPDSLRLTARALVQDYSHLAEALFTLRVQYYRLEMAWQGGEAQEFLNEFQQMLHRLEIRLDELLTLALTLTRQADLWEESDQRWAGIFRPETLPCLGL